MRIRGQELNIDFIEELEGFNFSKARIRDNKLQSCSPFREDSRPSFAVNLDNGTWIDSGADLDQFKKGNFISLLALLRGTDYSEVEEYLIDKYGINLDNLDSLNLNLHLDLGAAYKPQFKPVLNYNYSPYLDKARGVDKGIQELFSTSEGMIDGIRCIAIGWHNIQGKLINIKYRSTEGKKFWYEPDGEPIKNHLFGLDRFIKHRADELWIVEGEIDALYLWSLGRRAVALGRGSVNEQQLQLLKKSGAETLVIATDNDKVGRALCNTLVNELQMYFNIKIFKHPEHIKDVNELPRDTDFNSLILDIDKKINI